jgi:hypothetical protein
MWRVLYDESIKFDITIEECLVSTLNGYNKKLLFSSVYNRHYQI